MKRLGHAVLILSVFSLLFALSHLSWAQDEAAQPQPAAAPAASPAALETETQWLWGDVVIADSQAKSLTIKYLDYDTETEKQLAVTVDENTVYENVKSLDEIKPQQTVSIDYIVTMEGNNIARNISVEQAEAEVLDDELQQAAPADLVPEGPGVTDEERAGQ